MPQSRPMPEIGVRCHELVVGDHLSMLGSGRNPWYPQHRTHLRAWDEPWDRPMQELAAALSDLARA